MMEQAKRYCRIFRGVKLPWFLLACSLLIAFLSVQFDVESIELSASIIDASKNTISTNDLVKYVMFLLVAGVLMVGDVYVSKRNTSMIKKS